MTTLGQLTVERSHTLELCPTVTDGDRHSRELLDAAQGRGIRSGYEDLLDLRLSRHREIHVLQAVGSHGQIGTDDVAQSRDQRWDQLVVRSRHEYDMDFRGRRR